MIDFYFKAKAIETMISYGVIGLAILGLIIYVICVWLGGKK